MAARSATWRLLDGLKIPEIQLLMPGSSMSSNAPLRGDFAVFPEEAVADRRTPRERARSSPALVRSAIIARSNGFGVAVYPFLDT